MASEDRKHGGLARYVPAVRWLPRYERRWLRGDMTAGIAVTALVVPKNLGYALLLADGILELIGSDNIYGNVNRAIEAQRADGETSGPAPGGDATAGAVS